MISTFVSNSSLGLGYKVGSPTFAIVGPVSTRLFLSDGSDNPALDNADIFPIQMPRGADLMIFNSTSGSLGKDPAGTIEAGYTPTKTSAESIINAYPRRMLENLLLVSDENGFSTPVAGAYFAKLMDHEPGTVESLSCLITDANGQIEGLSITGTLSLTGGAGGDADTALNTFGKINTIDCGTFGES